MHTTMKPVDTENKTRDQKAVRVEATGVHDGVPRFSSLFFIDLALLKQNAHASIAFFPFFKHWDQAFGSDGDDFALCSAAGEEEVVIGGYTTGGLYSDENGKCRFEPGTMPSI